MGNISFAQKIRTDPRLDNGRTLLRRYAGRFDVPLPQWWDGVAALIDTAVRDSDQELAKMGWCLRQVGGIQDRYLFAWGLLRQGQYYIGWRELARCESGVRALWPHFTDEQQTMGVRFIQTQIARFQTLFPYRIFTSPDFLVLERRCSICDRPIRPRSRCEHKRGEIYDGRYCTGIVTRARLIGTSLVENPDFKANVVFLIDDETGKPFDHFDYPLLDYLMQHLASPWSLWDVRRTERLQPFSRCGDLDDDAPCPCESKVALRDCCRPRGGIRSPHVEFLLSDPVPLELQEDRNIQPAKNHQQGHDRGLALRKGPESFRR